MAGFEVTTEAAAQYVVHRDLGIKANPHIHRQFARGMPGILAVE